eukprot:7406252-Karenia_brevis.AAC.1
MGALEKYEGDEDADGEVPEGVRDDERESRNKDQDKETKKDRVVYIDTRSKVPRSFKISKDDISNHRGSSGCP